MKSIGVTKSFNMRARKSDTPIFEALTRCIYEFAKVGVLPRAIQRVELAPDVYDKLHAENKHNGELEGTWIQIGGLIIHRGK